MTKTSAGTLALLSLLTGCESTTPEPSGEVTAAAQLPCDVAEVLHQECLLCHSSVLALGAPMPLVTYAHTRAPHKGQPVWKQTLSPSNCKVRKGDMSSPSPVTNGRLTTVPRPRRNPGAATRSSRSA